MNNDYEKKNSFRMRQDSSHKERRDSSVEETGQTEAADGFRRTLAEKFLHTYITYHTYYRKLFPEEEGFTRAAEENDWCIAGAEEMFLKKIMRHIIHLGSQRQHYGR